MGKFMNRIVGTPDARENLRTAKADLAALTEGLPQDAPESDEYYAANSKVIAAEQGLKDSRSS